MNKNRLYIFLFLACLAGYIWVAWSLFFYQNASVCLFKHLTGIPCPSCGVSRSVFLLFKGDFEGAILMNPLGIVVALFMAIFPVWIIADVITKRDYLYKSYHSVEEIIRTKAVSIVLISLVLLNWIWNIYKGL